MAELKYAAKVNNEEQLDELTDVNEELVEEAIYVDDAQYEYNETKPKKKLWSIVGIVFVAAFLLTDVTIGINKLSSYNRYINSKHELEELIVMEDIDGLMNYIVSDDEVLTKNEFLATTAYELIYNSARTEMKEGSIQVASSMLSVLPDTYENVSKLKEKVDFYRPYDKKYVHAYSPYKLNIKINIDPDSDDVYVKCAEQPLLNATITYGATRVNNKDKNYSASFDMKTCEYKLITNNHISTRSGKYNH